MLSLPRWNLRGAATTRICRDCLRFNSSSPTSSTSKISPNPKVPLGGPSDPLAPSTPHDAPEKPRGKTIFSGIQPTGIPHLGNYLGALREWVKLQDSPEVRKLPRQGKTKYLFSIADMHAITAKHYPNQLRRWRTETFASLLAVGLDPKKSTLFCQSSVPQHAELMWVLSCYAPMGYLSRMTQWKVGLCFPVLIPYSPISLCRRLNYLYRAKRSPKQPLLPRSKSSANPQNSDSSPTRFYKQPTSFSTTLPTSRSAQTRHNISNSRATSPSASIMPSNLWSLSSLCPRQ